MYFSFQDQFYEQVGGGAMGSSVSPIVANLYMEYFEQKHFSTAPHPQALAEVCGWHMCHSEGSQQTGLPKHINSVDPAIQFTVESNKEDGAIPLLDTIVKPEADGNLSITVYRKPIHTDQYLQWDSHQHLSAKFSVIYTLTHKAQTVCSNPELLHKEMDHLRKALTQCKYPKWALDKVGKRLNKPSSELLMGLTIRAPQVPSPPPMNLKPRVILLYLTHKVSVKASRRSVGGMAYRPTSKVVAPSRT